MADFTKFKVGSTSYNVKDANAGRSLSVNGNQLQLKNSGGTAIKKQPADQRHQQSPAGPEEERRI